MSDLVICTQEHLEAAAEIAARKVIEESDHDNWMNFEELCAYLKFSRPTIQKWIDERGFPVVKKCEHPRFYKYSVDAWMLSDYDSAI